VFFRQYSQSLYKPMWKIVSKDEVSNFARISAGSIEDMFYDTTLGVVETFTGWSNLEAPINIIHTAHGHGSPILLAHAPINSVASITVNGAVISPSLYYVSWDKIYMKNSEENPRLQVFKRGFANIELAYNIGGIASIPENYQQSLKATLLLCIKEMVAIPRNEGSDQVLRKYRPDRTMMPEEVLKSYGVHGKIMGIIQANLPRRIKVT